MRTGGMTIVYSIYALSLIWMFLHSCTHQSKVLQACNPQYSRDIRPVINAKCALPACHGGNALLPDLTNDSIVKMYADNGRIRTNIFDLKIMPPASADSLSASEKTKFKCWLDNGAKQD
jgi:hypothetical protein